MSLRRCFVSIFVFGIFLLSFFAIVNSVQAVACGGSCAGSTAVCDGTLTCDNTRAARTFKCGNRFDTCIGANANHKTCTNNNAWDVTAPCDGTSAPESFDTCPSASNGIVRTAAWGALSACSASCGTGTQTQTCNCSASNGCVVTCLNPTAACNATNSPTCCVDSAPIAPYSVSVTNNNPAPYTTPTRVDVRWWFGSGWEGCSQPWGYVCSGRSNTFSIKIDGVERVTGLASNVLLNTITIGSWGAHTAEVCAANGYATTCSSPTSFTITPPDCTVTGQSPTSGCYTSFPTLSITSIGDGADSVQYAVDNENSFTDPWVCNSGWRVPGLPYSSCNPATGTYYWSVRAQSTNNPILCNTSALSPVYTIGVDKTAPSIPNPALVQVADGATGNYFVTTSWGDSTDTGCAGMSAMPYSSEMSLTNGGALVSGWDNRWTAGKTQTTSSSYPAGTTLYTRVKSKDTLGWESAWGTNSIVISCPALAPVDAPVITAPAASACLASSSTTINWTYGGNWGNGCGGTYTFEVREGASVLASVGSGVNTATVALTHGTHTIQVCAKNNVGSTCSASRTFSIDIQAPNPPAPVVSAVSCSGSVSVTWPEVSDNGCLGGVQYWLQTKDSAGNWYTNGWTSSLSSIITNTPVIGRAYQAQALSGDNGASHTYQSGWSGGTQWSTGALYCCPTTPTLISPIGGITCNDPTFPSLYQWNAVADATGYNLTISKGVSACVSSFAVGDITSYTLSAGQIAACEALGSGAYSWTIQATYDGGCSPSALSSVGAFTFNKTAQTFHVGGQLVEKVGEDCQDISLMSNFTLEPVISPSEGVTADCKMPTMSSYSCDFTINNQSGQCTNPNITVTMKGTYAGYSDIGWRSGGTAGACNGTPTSRTYTPGVIENATPLFFQYDNGGGGWFKMAQTSFNSRMSGRLNYLPASITAYDQDDSAVNRYLIEGSSGNIMQSEPVAIGASDMPYSANNWYTTNYSANTDISYSKYIDYIKARKSYTKITDLTEIEGDGIYSISTPVTLTAAQFDGKKVVLVVEGAAATFSGATFIPANGSLALVAKDIIIDPTVTEIDAILVGQTVSTGEAPVGLKIKGNLISESAVDVKRTQTNARKPSLFVVFNPKTYLDVLPYLSTSTYDWRQIQ